MCRSTCIFDQLQIFEFVLVRYIEHLQLALEPAKLELPAEIVLQQIAMLALELDGHANSNAYPNHLCRTNPLNQQLHLHRQNGKGPCQCLARSQKRQRCEP